MGLGSEMSWRAGVGHGCLGVTDRVEIEEQRLVGPGDTEWTEWGRDREEASEEFPGLRVCYGSHMNTWSNSSPLVYTLELCTQETGGLP